MKAVCALVAGALLIASCSSSARETEHSTTATYSKHDLRAWYDDRAEYELFTLLPADLDQAAQQLMSGAVGDVSDACFVIHGDVSDIDKLGHASEAATEDDLGRLRKDLRQADGSCKHKDFASALHSVRSANNRAGFVIQDVVQLVGD